MKCPFCQSRDHHVVDSRFGLRVSAIRRRRECHQCGKRWTTVEAAAALFVGENRSDLLAAQRKKLAEISFVVESLRRDLVGVMEALSPKDFKHNASAPKRNPK